MLKLRANKASSKYKDKNSYLNAVFRKNKDIIVQKMKLASEEGGKLVSLEEESDAKIKQIWKDEVMAQYKNNKGHLSINQSIDIVTKSEQITSESERFKENVIKAIKKEKGTFKELRLQVGWKHKIDTDNIDYLGKDLNKNISYYTYSLGDSRYVVIGIKDSPKGNNQISINTTGESGVNSLEQMIDDSETDYE